MTDDGSINSEPKNNTKTVTCPFVCSMDPVMIKSMDTDTL